MKGCMIFCTLAFAICVMATAVYADEDTVTIQIQCIDFIATPGDGDVVVTGGEDGSGDLPGSGDATGSLTESQKQWIRENWGYDPDVAYGTLTDPVSGGADEWMSVINASSVVSFEHFKQWYGSITLSGFKSMFNLR